MMSSVPLKLSNQDIGGKKQKATYYTLALPRLSRCEKELGRGVGLKVPFSMLV